MGQSNFFGNGNPESLGDEEVRPYLELNGAVVLPCSGFVGRFTVPEERGRKNGVRFTYSDVRFVWK
jgi:hypothetical protein